MPTRFASVLLSLATLLLLLLLTPVPGRADHAGHWHRPREGSEFGISGMAVVAEDDRQTTFLVVHDNKRPKDEAEEDRKARLGLIKVEAGGPPSYQRVEVKQWQGGGKAPNDLEAVAAIPGPGGRPEGFIAVTSDGLAFRLKLDVAGRSAEVVGEPFEVPGYNDKTPDERDFEGFAVSAFAKPDKDRWLCVWTRRGQDEAPAEIHWGWLDLSANRFEALGSIERFTTPWPTTDVRYVSDVRVDADGVMWVASASDPPGPPKDEGPFRSAVYKVGAFTKVADAWGERGVVFPANPTPVEVFRSDGTDHPFGHKIEAVEFTRRRLVVAGDDENKGGWVLWAGDPAPSPPRTRPQNPPPPPDRPGEGRP